MAEPTEFIKLMAELDLTSSQLAKRLNVTPRAISYWLGGGRKVPAPVMAYMRLLKATNPSWNVDHG